MSAVKNDLYYGNPELRAKCIELLEKTSFKVSASRDIKKEVTAVLLDEAILHGAEIKRDENGQHPISAIIDAAVEDNRQEVVIEAIQDVYEKMGNDDNSEYRSVLEDSRRKHVSVRRPIVKNEFVGYKIGDLRAS